MFELTFLTKFDCKGIHMSQVFFLLFLYTGITQIFICIIIVWGGLAFFLSLNERAGKIYYLAFIWLRINSLAKRMFEINIMTSKDLPNPYPCIKKGRPLLNIKNLIKITQFIMWFAGLFEVKENQGSTITKNLASKYSYRSNIKYVLLVLYVLWFNMYVLLHFHNTCYYLNKSNITFRQLLECKITAVFVIHTIAIYGPNNMIKCIISVFICSWDK